MNDNDSDDEEEEYVADNNKKKTVKYFLKLKLMSNRDVFHSYSIDEEEWNKARLMDKDISLFFCQ